MAAFGKARRTAVYLKNGADIVVASASFRFWHFKEIGASARVGARVEADTQTEPRQDCKPELTVEFQSHTCSQIYPAGRASTECAVATNAAVF